MKQLVCEMCGNTDLVKDGGVFVCQSCGCNYSVEEAKKMMVEGTVNVQGTVKVDNTAQIDNFLRIAKNALDASNNEEADDYANKILEIEPHHAEAWLIKGEAVGWQTTNQNDRLQESVNAWTNAVLYADAKHIDEYRSQIANKSGALYLAVIDLKAGNFGRIHNDNMYSSLELAVKSCVSYMNQLSTKAGVRINRSFLYQKIARKLNSAAVDGFKDAQSDFGPEHINMSKFEWNRFTASCDLCIKLIEFALKYARTNDQRKTMYENLVTIGETARDSCSWKFDVNSYSYDHYVREYQFTSEAKKARTENISTWKSKKDALDTSKKEATLKALHGSRDDEEKALAIKKYWEEHAGEKQAFETEKTEAKARIDQIEKGLSSLPVLSEIADAESKVKSLNAKLSALGMFKGKEKAAVREQIAAAEKKVADLKSRADAEKKPLSTEADNLKKRIGEIDDEFAKDRGRVSLEESTDLSIPDAVVEGKIRVTPKMLANHLGKILPANYAVSFEQNAAPSIEMNAGGATEIDIRKGEEHANVHLYCYGKGGDEPIELLLLEMISNDIVSEDLTDWVVVGSNVLCALTKSDTSKNWAEGLFCDLVDGDASSLGAADGLSIEYIHDERALSFGAFGSLLSEEANGLLAALGIIVAYRGAIIRSKIR